jgi:Ca2+-binding RTX toxin-like protein
MASIDGTIGDNILDSLSTNDRIRGGSGNDTYRFSGSFGSDEISDFGLAIDGGGNDLIELIGIGAANVRMSTSNDSELNIYVVDANGTIISSIEVENHFFSLNYRMETLKFGDGSSLNLTGGLTVQGTQGQSNVLATKFDDVLISSAGSETLIGGSGNDTYRFSGSFGIDTIRDYSVYIDGGGSDAVELAGVAASNVRISRRDGSTDLDISVVDANGQTVSSVSIDAHFSGGSYQIETLRLGDGTSINLTGPLTVQGVRDESNVTATTLADTLIASAWNENLVGGSGDDNYRFTAGFGFDTIQDNSLYIGGGGNDLIDMSSISSANIRMSRSSDELVISVVDANGAAVSSVSVSNHFDGGDYLVETLRTSAGDLALTGGLTVQGTRNQTTLAATTFDDTVIVSSWNEALQGGAGNDTYRFSTGFGTDTLREAGGAERIVLDSSINLADVRIARASLGSSDLVIGLADASETLTSKVTIQRYFDGGDYKVEELQLADGSVWSIDALLANVGGGPGADSIASRPGSTVIDSGDGDDSITDLWGNNTVNGGNGNDRMTMGDGEDILNGAGGKDWLHGGKGLDTLTGGAGKDRFVFTSIEDSLVFARDKITDFKSKQDKIDLRAIDADIDGTGGNQNFKYIGSKKFSGKDGELQFKKGILSGDVNGDKVADFQIELFGLKKMLVGDFIL